MNEYYRWSEDLADYGTSVIQLSRLKLAGLNEWDLIDGKKIDEWSNRNEGFFDEGGIAYDLLNTTMQVHVISKKLKDAMKSLGLSGVQYLPLPIHSEEGTRMSESATSVRTRIRAATGIQPNPKLRRHHREPPLPSARHHGTPNSEIDWNATIASYQRWAEIEML